MGETKGPKKEARTDGAGKDTSPPNDPNLILVLRLPLSVRRLLQSTPPREWYRIKAFRPKYEETVELTHIIHVLDYLLDMAPARLIARMHRKAITPQAINDAFRRVHDAINGLKDSCPHIAGIARMKIRAWRDRNSQPAAAAPRAMTAGSARRRKPRRRRTRSLKSGDSQPEERPGWRPHEGPPLHGPPSPGVAAILQGKKGPMSIS